MSFQNTPQKKLYDGKTLVPLSVASDILEIREAIESNEQHAGPTLELVYQAYCEIQEAHGHVPHELKPTCSSCIGEMNKKLKKWFKLYDQGSVPQKAAAGGFKSKPLKPLKKKEETKPVKAPGNTEKSDNASKKAEPAPKKEDTPEKGKDRSEMSYAQLLKEFEATASQKVQKSINDGKKPKKTQILEYLKNPKKYEQK